MLRHFLFVFLFSFLLQNAYSQMCFEKNDLHSSLSYYSVLSVIQDHNDFLWVGTRDGLNKFNSVDNEVFRHDINNPTSLSNSSINWVFESKQHEIWVGTANGLNKYNPLTNDFQQFLVDSTEKGLTNGYLRCVSEDTEGNLWIGTGEGLNKLNTKTSTFEHYFLAPQPTLLNNVIAVFHDSKQRMWLGTRGGLFIFEKGSFIPITLLANLDKSLPFEIRDIKQSENGQMWIATEEYGVFSFYFLDNQVVKLKNYSGIQNGFQSNAVRKIWIDGENILLATLKDVIVLTKDTKTSSYTSEVPKGLANTSYHDILKDKSGGYWLASYTDALYYYHPQNHLFEQYSYLQNSSKTNNFNEITGFVEDAKGNFWISTGSRGLNYWDIQNDTILNFRNQASKGLSCNTIKSMSADKDGNLWIATINGLNFFNTTTKIVKRFYHNDFNSSLSFNQVHAVFVDSQGMVWVGFNGGEFQVYDPEKESFVSVVGVGRFVDAIFEDSKGRLWIGDRLGLSCIDTRTKQILNISHQISSVKEKLSYINWITEDSKGRIWVGTQASGIVVIDSGESYWFSKDNGLTNNTINAILQDKNEFFWVSTNNGILKLEFVHEQGKKAYIKTTDFSVINGLQGNQFEKGSALKTSQGFLLFGGINGFNLFFPEKVTKMNYTPKVVFSEFRINNEDMLACDTFSVKLRNINEIDKVVLKYDQRNVLVRFAGINFINSEGTFYRYKLKDLNKEWVNLEHQRNINFTYLPVGEHELQIQASTDNQTWGEEYTRLTLQILPPWWQTWWAYVLYGILILVLLYIFFYYSQKWANLKNSLELQEYKREKDLELYDSKLRFFTDVSHELRTPLTLILAPLERIMEQKSFDEEFNKQLHIIRRNGNRMMQLINQVLNLRKLEKGHDKLKASKNDIVPFLKEISLAFDEIALARKIDFKFETEFESKEIWFDLSKMESIVYNLLSNAFKFTKDNGEISLNLSLIPQNSYKRLSNSNLNSDIIEISVSNLGKYISDELRLQIFERFYSNNKENQTNSKSTGVGLELTKRMVELHHGSISVESKRNENDSLAVNKFFFQIPVGKEHLLESEILSDFKNSETPSLYTQNMQLSEKVSILKPLETLTPDDVLPKLSDQEKQTLLIVEDNEEVRQFVCDLFRNNYIVIEAENGLQAWEKSTEILPDLIISDIMMPEINGIELCRKLKTDLRTSHIPVILLTARTTIAFRNEGIETGADEYITKPFSAEFLMIRVKNLILQRELLKVHFQRNSIFQTEDIAVTSVDERLLKKALEYIHTHIENPNISVVNLSKELGLSRVHFYRKIKAITNLTAVDFIKNVRLKRAASLLQQNKLTIKEIQFMVGFKEADYFRKCFKNQFDMSPTQYAAQFDQNTD